MSRRTLFVIIGSVGLIGLFLLVLAFWPAKETPSKTASGGEDFFPTSPTESNSGDFFGIGDSSDEETEGAFSGLGDEKKVFYTKITSTAITAPKSLGTEENLNLRLRYVERETGHIYEYDPRTNTGKRISNTTMPRVFQALWSDDGARVILRAFDGPENTVRTFAARISTATSTSETSLRGEFLPNSIVDLAISPSGKKVFYILESGGKMGGFIYDFDKETTIKSFAPPSKEWLVSWPLETKLVFASRASSGTAGFVYTVDLSSGTPTFKKVFGGYNGLTILADSTLGRFIIGFAASGEGRTAMLLGSGLWSNGSLTDFPIDTLPEKCVWGKRNSHIAYCAAPNTVPEGAYPDNWYLGLVSFGDMFWSVDVSQGSAETLFNPEITAGEKIDAKELTLDATEHYLFFINKRDDSLWSLRLDTPTL